MTQTKNVTSTTWWQRVRDWMLALDEAVHTTEADILRRQVVRIEARLTALEARQQAPDQGEDGSDRRPQAIPAGGA